MGVGGQYAPQSEFLHHNETGEIGKGNARLVAIAEPQTPSGAEAFRCHVLDVEEFLPGCLEYAFRKATPRRTELPQRAGS